MPDDRSLSLFKAASAVARKAPAPLSNSLARALGGAAALPPTERRLLVARNMLRANPGLRGLALRRAVRRCFESYARYWAESFRLPGLSPETIEAGLTPVGYEHIEAARASGVGPLIVLPHLGGWEWAGFWIARVKNVPITVVVERLEPPSVFDWFVEFRRSLGMNVVPLGPDAGRDVIRAVKAGHVVCLLSDRDITGSGVEVEFFGEKTTLPAGPATLALRTGAPLLPTAVYFRGARHLGVVNAPLPVERTGNLRADITRITQDIAHSLEGLIREAPEQWHLMQPNWPSDHAVLERAKKGRAAAD
jgi:phosphatidylinositol dimannoside acyltransferase